MTKITKKKKIIIIVSSILVVILIAGIAIVQLTPVGQMIDQSIQDSNAKKIQNTNCLGVERFRSRCSKCR